MKRASVLQKMKRVVSVLLIFALIFVLCACDEKKDDEVFLKNLRKGLEARWKITNAEPETFATNADYKDYAKKYVNAEIKAIGDISEYTFENDTLKEYANEYVEALNSQLTGIEFYGSNDLKYTELFTEKGYYIRARIFTKLKNEYSFSVSRNNESTLDDLVVKGRLLLEQDDMIQRLESIISSGVTLESNSDTNCELLLENLSDSDYSNIQLNLNLYDDSGFVVKSSTIYKNSWLSRTKVKEIVYNNEPFSSAELQIGIYSALTNDYVKTDFIPITYINNLHIDIELKTKLPRTISYSDGKIYTKCSVNSFSFEVERWNNGEATVCLEISGKKTYDIKGDSYSRGCKIGWKLYDIKGRVVIDSGNFNTSSISVGETFSQCTDKVYNLPIGSYTLELLNVG